MPIHMHILYCLHISTSHRLVVVPLAVLVGAVTLAVATVVAAVAVRE